MAYSFNDTIRLRRDLLTDYNVGVVPVRNQSMSVAVNMSFFLILIHHLNTRNQVLTASGWLKLTWEDDFLKWDPDEYGGIDELILFQKEVWLPDVFVENTAKVYQELGNSQMLISVLNTGTVHWEPGIITETSCIVNIEKYPFDTQTCEIRFLTWMHTNRTLTVSPEHDVIHLEPTLPNGEWDITSTEAKAYFYPSTYRAGTEHTGVTFIIHLRRKIFFYILNTIIPVVLLSCLNVLVFILPSDCGERMALAVTVLLAFTVYLGIISDNVPKTSDRPSLLAIYLTILLAMSTASVVCAGMVLNIHYRDPSICVPPFLRWLFSYIIRHKKNQHGGSGLDSPRNSVSHWEYHPVFLDRRRPSIWGKRMAMRESRVRASFAYCDDDLCDDKDDCSKSEKSVFVRSTSLQHKFTDTSENHGVDTIDETKTVPIKTSIRSDANKNEALHPVNSNKHVAYDEMTLLDSVTSPNHIHSSHPGEEGKAFLANERKTNIQETCDHHSHDDPSSEQHYTEADGLAGFFYRNKEKKQLEKSHSNHSADDKKKEYAITWHDIGNELDRILFWVFFIVTNTVTVVILSMFVREV